MEADPGLIGQVGDPLDPQDRRELGEARSGSRRAGTTGIPSMTTLPQGTWAPVDGQTGSTATWSASQLS